MYRVRMLAAMIAVAALAAACGSDTTSSSTSSSAPPETTAPSTTLPETTVPDTTSPDTTSPDTTQPAVPQIAIWPAADVVFTTPEAAAQDFLLHAFGAGPMIGDFQAGDSRSGEFEVFASADGRMLDNARSVLLMRQLPPSDGWFVLAAASDMATITTPESGATVPAAPLTVEGVARGFEANIGSTAFLRGNAEPLDQQTTLAGNFDQPLPYSMSLDLTGVAKGDVVVVLVHGGAGLETDPGDFSAIPVLVG